MRLFLAMFLACMGTALIACESGDSIPSATGPFGSEQALRAAITEHDQAICEWDAGDSFVFHAKDLRERCPYGDWVAFLAAGKLLLGEDIFKDAETIIDSIRFEDDKAFVERRLVRDGILLFSFPDPDDEFPGWWIWEDGQWRVTDDDPTPCDISD